MKSVLMLFVCCGLGIGTLTAAELPNGSFEEGSPVDGSFQPAGWTPPSGTGQVLTPGYQSDRCIQVTGDRNNDGAWISDPVQVQPGDYYEFSFWSKAEPGNQGGSAVSGPTFCNRDFWVTESWQKYSYIFRVPENETEARFRLGQWQVKGQIEFDGVRITPVQPIYQQQGNWVLGQNEKIEDGQYDAQHILGGEESNTCRFLKSTTAGFNSNRWIFNPESSVIYRHTFPDNAILQGAVSVNLNYHNQGILKVGIRKEEGEWIELGTLDHVTSQTWDFPESMNKAQTIEIKLEGVADNEKGCNFQVDQFRFTAQVETPVTNQGGNTHFVRILETDPRLQVTIQNPGNPQPGVATQFHMELKNLDEQTQALHIELEIASSSKTNSFEQNITLDSQKTRIITIPYTLVESGTAVINVHVKEAAGSPLYTGEIQFEIPDLYAVDYGDLIAHGEQADLWWCPAMYKVAQNRPAPQGGNSTVEFSAARGEYEPVQIVIRPNQPLSQLHVSWDDLTDPSGNKIPKSVLSIRQVDYVHVTHPSDSWGCEAWWPDPLPPVEAPLALAKDRNYPFWVTVKVPLDTKAGLYTGILQFHAENWENKVPIQLRVFDFTVPQTFSVRSAFGFTPNVVSRYHHLETEDELKKVVDLYYQDFREHRISPYNPTQLYPIRAELTDHYTFDFSDFDRAGQRYFDEFGFTSLHLPLQGMGGGTFHDRHLGKIGSYEQGTPEHERLFREYASTVEQHLKEKGWLDKAFIYWFDEPEPRDYEFVKEGMDLIHRNAPGLKRFLTEQPEKELQDAADIWCAILDAYKSDICHELQQQGDEIWWYICTGPKQPYPGLFIDHPVVDLRAWLWMTQKYDVQGCLVWESNYWSSDLAYPEPNIQDPWTDPMSYVTGYGNPVGYRSYWGNGDGRFIYPPKNWKEGKKLISGPIDSIRWEMLREGMEDFEYFTLIKKKLAEGTLSQEQTQRANALLSIPEEIVKSTNEYTKDARLYYEYRAKLADFLESASSQK